jgi:hypothetical protein
MKKVLTHQEEWDHNSKWEGAKQAWESGHVSLLPLLLVLQPKPNIMTKSCISPMLHTCSTIFPLQIATSRPVIFHCIETARCIFFYWIESANMHFLIELKQQDAISEHNIWSQKKRFSIITVTEDNGWREREREEEESLLIKKSDISAN